MPQQQGRDPNYEAATSCAPILMLYNIHIILYISNVILYILNVIV